MNALLSIKPRYAEAILTGTKKWEFRTRRFQRTPDKVFIYCSTPVRKVVGVFETGKIISGSPNKIWKMCGKEGTISKKEFFEYFNYKIVYAIQISRAKKLDVPIELNSLGKSRPPQSFYYIDDIQNLGVKREKFFIFNFIKKSILGLAIRRR